MVERGTDEGCCKEIFTRCAYTTMSDGDTIREQFSALQRQQKDRLNQLQEKSAKKKTSYTDVSCTDELIVDFLRFAFRPTTRPTSKLTQDPFPSKRCVVSLAVALGRPILV